MKTTEKNFNFFYYGNPISYHNFINEVSNDWEYELNTNLEFTWGGYSARLKEVIQVDPLDFEVYSYEGGYYSIKGYIYNIPVEVLGGDSANEDDHDKEYFDEVMERWDGRLEDMIGYRISLSDTPLL